MSLVEGIITSDTKRRHLHTWVTSRFQEAVKWNTEDEEKREIENASEIHKEINSFIRYASSLDEYDDLDSHFIGLNLSQLYTICLKRLEKNHPERIFDSAELMIKILSEEDVALDNEGDQTGKQTKKKKKAKKKTYTYSSAKDLACIILINFFEVFGNRFSSLAPLLFATVFKNLKKALEKSKYMHATFVTYLVRLINVMVRNGNQEEFSKNYFQKFSKISKLMFEGLYTGNQDFPVDFVSSVIEIWSVHFTHDTFIKDHMKDISGAILAKYSDGEIGSYGFTNNKTRPSTAKSLAEIFFDYHFSKNIIEIADIWVIYIKIFRNASTRDVQVGIFESIVHFLGLCSTTSDSFLDGYEYLTFIRSLVQEVFQPASIKHENIEQLYRYLRYFDRMHENFLPHLSDSSKTQILFRMLGSPDDADFSEHHKDFEIVKIDDKLENQWLNLAQLNLSKVLLMDLSSSFANEKYHINDMRQVLIVLSTCEVFTIRIHANEVLKVFLSNFPEFLAETMESSLQVLTENFKNSEMFQFSLNHGHALILANLIDIADKDYVSYELIMRITVFSTSFIKNHTTSTSGDLYYKGLICWILLIGLLNYNDEQYIIMQSSQLFLFWKVLLTHSFAYRDEDELYRNLEIRNHSLTCLLTYIGNGSIDQESAKQISYLLVKCSNFNHSISIKSNNIDRVLLINEHRILQIYLRLNEHIKKDFNSSLLILIVKNFSDPNLYVEHSHSMLESFVNVIEKKPLTKDIAKDENIYDNTVESILNLSDGFGFGISSKITVDGTRDLAIKFPQKNKDSGNVDNHSTQCYWNDGFEKEITKPITPVLAFDYLIVLYGAGYYTLDDQYSPKITTSLIDSSMEIFSLIFPYLNGKIQYSVIESLNSSMFSKLTSPLRSAAVAANVCVALNSALNIISRNELSLENSVGQLLIDTMKKIDFYKDPYLANLKADCIGLICQAVNRKETIDNDSKKFVVNQTNIFVKNVIDVEDPYKRIFNALSLGSIYRYNSQVVSFSSMFDIIFALIQDPHPVVHIWSLKAMHILLKKHFSIDTLTASKILFTIEGILIDPAYGLYGSSTLRYNYNSEFDSHLIVAQILETITEILGPNIIELDPITLDSHRNMTISYLISNNVKLQSLSLFIYEMLTTFKLQHIVGDEAFISTAKSIVNDGIVSTFGSTYLNSRFTGSNELFANNSSLFASFKCLDLFSQLLKLQKGHLINSDIDSFCWKYLDLYPSSDIVVKFFFTWIEQSYKMNERWFDKLYLFFNMSEKKLFKGTYHDYSIILAEKGSEKVIQNDLHGEEEEAITHSGNDSSFVLHEKSFDKIHWRARKTSLELVKVLCDKSNKDGELYNIMKTKISQLIKISFQASVCKVSSMQLLGLDILRNLLNHYSTVTDPENLEHLILEMEEAQIISALMPAFDEGTAPDVVVTAINVCADFLSSNIVPLKRVNRVSEMMINFLEVYRCKDSEIKIGDAKIITHKAKKKIELAILDSWSTIVQNALQSGNEDLVDFTRNYWEVLVPLWIISLRDYVMIKYENVQIDEKKQGKTADLLYESRKTKIELYDDYWLNFAIALGSILDNDSNLISNCLNNEEAESFMFILFAQCIEAISKHIDNSEVKMKVLPALHNILKCHISLDSLFEDELNEEVVGVFERLIIIGSKVERLELVKVINDLIVGYTKKNNTDEKFLPGIDKLYELLRLLIIPIAEILPCIKYNSDEQEEEVNSKIDKNDLILVKYIFTVLESNVSVFGDIFKADLYACFLYIIGRIFEDDRRDIVIPSVLPLLKSIMVNVGSMVECTNMINIFYEAVKGIVFGKLNNENKLVTLLVFLNNGYRGFSTNDLEICTEIIVESLLNPGLNTIATHGLISMIGQVEQNNYCAYVLKCVLRKVYETTNDFEPSISRGIILVTFSFCKHIIRENTEKTCYAFTFCINMIVSCIEKSSGDLDEMVIQKVVDLMKLDAESFKKVYKGYLSESQKRQIEVLMKHTPHFGLLSRSQSGNDKLELKKFI